MMTKINNLSPIPVPTWNWLKINNTALRFNLNTLAYNSNPIKQCPSGAKVSKKIIDAHLSQIPVVLKGTAAFVAENKTHNLQIIIEENSQPDQPIIIDYELGKSGQKLINHIDIEAKSGSKSTVIIRYTNNSDSPVYHAGYVNTRIEENANLQLVSAQLLGKADTHLDGVCSEVAENGRLHLVLAEIGAEQSVSGADISLFQTGAFSRLDSIFMGAGRERKDLNYRICFGAPQTEGYISSNGALADESKKITRSTIDFIKGATESKGREEESVLVLSDSVTNISTPLLLCGEENVEGQHATSIGRPNPDKLYYLISRGLSEIDARKLLVEAALTPVLEGISLPELQEELLTRIREGMMYA